MTIVERNTGVAIAKTIIVDSLKGFNVNLPLNCFYTLLFFKDNCQIKTMDIVTTTDSSANYVYKFNINLSTLTKSMKLVRTTVCVNFNFKTRQFIFTPLTEP